MDIMLNDILHLTEKEITKSKIEFNMTAGKNGPPIISSWLNHLDLEKEQGLCKECSYWGWRDKTHRNYIPGQIAFSFVRIEGDEWLLISVAEILEVPKNSHAVVRIIEEYKPFFGRLIIKCSKGNNYSRYVYWMETFINVAIVKEILPCPYTGERFEGYDNVYLSYDKLKGVFSGKMMPTYYDALRKVKGVYCLTDKKTGKLYIGSATGEDGVAQRWGNYLSSKDGGNKKLRALKREKGEKYFEENFTYTLIEFFTLSYDDEKIREREKYWKRCFNTVEMGYNDNY